MANVSITIDSIFWCMTFCSGPLSSFDTLLEQKKLHLVSQGPFPREWQNLYQTEVLYKVAHGAKLLPADLVLDINPHTKEKHILVAGTVWNLKVSLYPIVAEAP